MKKYILVLAFAWIIPNLDWEIYLDMFPSIRETAIAESGSKNFPMGNPNAKNPKDTDGRPKYGLLQYGKWEFNTWSKEAGIKNPDVWNPLHQIITYRWADENGLAYRWGTFLKLVRSGKIIIDL